MMLEISLFPAGLARKMILLSLSETKLASLDKNRYTTEVDYATHCK